MAVGAAAGGVAIAGLSVATSAILLGVGSFALGILQQALAPKLNIPNLKTFETQASARTSFLRQPITARRLPCGEVIISGPLTFYEVTESNRYHHMVITLGDAPAAPWDGISIVWLDDVPVFPDQLDAGGNVVDGKFAGKVRIKRHLGGPDQIADPDLIAEIDRLDESFRGRGVAYLYIRVDWNRDLFPSGLPKPRALCRTNLPLDPRDGQRRWTANAALALHEYVTEPELGLGYETADLETVFAQAAANTCDEIADTAPVGHAVVAVDAAADALDLAIAGTGAPVRLETGDRVEIFTDGTAPGGLAAGTPYYAIVERLVAEPFADDDAVIIPLSAGDYTGAAAAAIAAGDVDAVHGAGLHARVRLAATYADALARTAVAVTSAGSGQHVLVKTGEPRYTAAGVIETDRNPKANIEDLLLAMAGRLVWTGGAFRILPAAWRPGALSFDESDLMGPLVVSPKRSRRERFNAVQGIFATHLTVGEPTDYPAVIDDSFVTADGGNRIFADIPRPFTSRVATAERLGWIELGRHRREITVEYPTTLKGLDAVPGTVVSISNARRGWTDKTFEVIEQEDAFFGDGEPKLQGVVLKLAETDAAVFDFDPATQEVVRPPQPIPPGGNPLTVAAPGPPQVTEALFTARQGGGVKAKAVLAWAAAPDQFVVEYQPEFKGAASAQYTVLPLTPDTTAEVLDIPPGLYDFRLKAINAIGVASAYSAITRQEILGLAAPPAALQDLSIGVLGGLAVLRWARAADLDVREGGRIEFRHATAAAGGDVTGSTSIGQAVEGDVTQAALPLKPGAYFARAVDASGVAGPWSQVETKGASVLAFAAVTSLAEAPIFAGSHSGTVGIDGKLKLAGAGSFDAIPDFDAVSDLDSFGGIATAGTYDFAGGIDFGTLKRVRLRPDIDVLITQPLAVIDDRTDPIDSWSNFDGVAGDEADVQLWFRETDDDPGGSPAWSAWQRADGVEVEARGLQFQARLASSDKAFNIEVSKLSVTAEEVA